MRIYARRTVCGVLAIAPSRNLAEAACIDSTRMCHVHLFPRISTTKPDPRMQDWERLRWYPGFLQAGGLGGWNMQLGFEILVQSQKLEENVSMRSTAETRR